MTNANLPGDDEELKLSPSETIAHNSAMRLSGSAKGRRSTQRALASIVLGFELFVVFLGGMTVFGLGAVQPRELGIYGGLALCLLIIIALGTMRTKLGIWIGWGVHLAMFLAGFILPMFVIVAVIFTALWVYCMITGARMDRQAAARFGQAPA
ncbi:DUF4233 domain-containing protein [Leucobacter sp. M11]|uniref:DUF4233 domain-containing protein n=1 Tax=Leucobacter sp. M11 TaxID=2993565 RepID=UPI002D7E5AC0|nr:DUF4233 domain-containing protein [Leucobacter sp. M11]MEB4616061.1 DUF4233 domain-containing protein [Leucobacter sp. M11]